MGLRNFLGFKHDKILIGIAAMAGAALGSFSWAQLGAAEVQPYLEVDEDALQLPYGIWAETEIELKNAPPGPIVWDVLNATLPEGLSLEDTPSTNVLIWGTPRFTGLWCFNLGAKIADEIIAQKRLCFAGENGKGEEEVPHPRFKTDRFLPAATAGSDYEATIDVELEGDSSTYVGLHYDGVLPEGLGIESRSDDWQFVIWGRADAVDHQEFVLKIEDDLGRQTFQQFQLTVEERDSAPSCPPGYYYDENLVRCVQEKLETCPDGTYYEPDSNTCVRYPLPPPTVYCPPGTYFDSFLSQCVSFRTPRCPVNYRWNRYYDRCVREAYSCPIGSRYDWRDRRCEYVWRLECPRGSIWDSYFNRCVRYERNCRPGQYWDTRTHSCRFTERGCRAGEVYDPQLNRCRPRRPHCAPGDRFDPVSGRCIGIRPPRPNCGPGKHYDPRRGGCVANSNPRPKPPKPMNPPPMPMNPPMNPPPMPMNPPMNPPPMPMNPPMNPPPMPMNPPMNPPSMPMNPSPMPMPRSEAPADILE